MWGLTLAGAVPRGECPRASPGNRGAFWPAAASVGRYVEWPAAAHSGGVERGVLEPVATERVIEPGRTGNSQLLRMRSWNLCVSSTKLPVTTSNIIL